jgi:hypothetical protein
MRQAAGITERRQRAADQAELARQISQALQARDVVSARVLIADGAALYGHSALLAAVELQASQNRMQAMEAAGEPYHREVDPWSDDREPYGLEDERSEDERW